MDEKEIMKRIRSLKRKKKIYLRLYRKWSKLRGYGVAILPKSLSKHTISLAEIEKFEKENQCILPLDYKLYLQHVKNGGSSPSGGKLLSLKDTLKDPNLDYYTITTEMLNKKFIFTQDIDHISKYPLEKLINKDISDFYPFMYDNLPIFYQGCIFLADTASEIMPFLVINGPEAGNIWESDYHTFYAIKSKKKRKNRVNFLEWMEEYEDDLIHQKKINIKNLKKKRKKKITRTKF